MENNKLYVGNLSYSVTNDQLEDLFTNYGEVINTNIIDGKGFGFVEMASSSEAEKITLLIQPKNSFPLKEKLLTPFVFLSHLTKAGNSLAAIVGKEVKVLAQDISNCSFIKLNSTVSFGKKETNSVIDFAETVISPCFSTLAATSFFIPVSRSVATTTKPVFSALK